MSWTNSSSVAARIGWTPPYLYDRKLRSRLRRITVPTLVVWGYNDPAAQIENGMQLIELFMHKQRDTEVRIFNKSGHFVMREHPAAFNRLIDTYVDAHR